MQLLYKYFFKIVIDNALVIDIIFVLTILVKKFNNINVFKLIVQIFIYIHLILKTKVLIEKYLQIKFYIQIWFQVNFDVDFKINIFTLIIIIIIIINTNILYNSLNFDWRLLIYQKWVKKY